MVEHEHESEKSDPPVDDESLEEAMREASGDVAKTPGDDGGPTANEATEDT